MAIETKEQQYLRRIATALESIAKGRSGEDELTAEQVLCSKTNVLDAADLIRHYCKAHQCYVCPLSKNGSCVLQAGCPENWEV